MRNVVLFGGGVQVQYCIDIIERMKDASSQSLYHIVGIIDSRVEIGTDLFGYKVVGRQENIAEISERLSVKAGVVTIGDNYSRDIVRREVEQLLPDFEWINAIHPSCIIGNNVSFGKGVVAMAGCIFNTGATLGDFTFFATGAQIEHDCTIEAFASVSAGSVMGGFVKIGRYSAVTLGCTIMDRLSIGENSVIGSGSLVNTDVPDNVLCYGSPARVIKARKPGEKFLKGKSNPKV
jgi:sugar O-acyltransferase (sialic acid O-acetyltransferase NeuD family)